MFFKRSVLFSIFLFIFVLQLVNSDEVPTILWNVKGNALLVKPVSALERDDWSFNENVETVLSNNNNANILVFSVNKLSSEDFSSHETSPNSTISNLQDFLDTRPYIYMSSVRDPLIRLHNVHCGVQEIVVDQSIDENILQSVSLAFGQSCVVILHLSDFGIFNTNDQKPEAIQRVFLPLLSDVSKNVVGIFTAEKSSWSGITSDHHFTRNLFEIDEADPNFLNLTCVYMYISNATVQYKNESAQLALPPNGEGTTCGNDSVSLQLTFVPSGDFFTSVVVNFLFKQVMGSWVTETTISVSGKQVPSGDLPTISDFIEAPLKYSFNCGELKLKTTNDTNVIITMQEFQVQPFPTDSSGFSESFDCVSFFTVPIWMGVFVSLLFIIIINIGVYALFSVHTMDRFDDPKGKTISVAVGSD
ncbi:V-type proton ATPase subunit S1 [Parasteatoda tepidariorum]|uniref:V-type proton ATPase subunit S1 n=1 Tax=Parasteatoda tepidariorum TaxID=114398 RepID=UPI00077FB1AB|nr:V-type proton ATPase subunit S1 [Parasteatoda tepidariorum]